MGTLEIIGGVLLLIASIIIIVMVLIQDNKDQGLSSAIQGGSADSYFNKNSGRTKDARLNRITRVCAIIFFVITILVNAFILIENKKEEKKASDESSSTVVSEVVDSTVSGSVAE